MTIQQQKSFWFNSLKATIKHLNQNEKLQLTKFFRSCSENTERIIFREAVSHFFNFIQKFKSNISTKMLKIYFVYFLWIAFHFENVGDFIESEEFYEEYELENENVDLEFFLAFEPEVLQHFEVDDSTEQPLIHGARIC